MEFSNFLSPYGEVNSPVIEEALRTLLLLLYPFTPHLAQELWERMGFKEDLSRYPWPRWEEESLKEEEFILVIQVNGKVRDRMRVPVGWDRKRIEEEALRQEKVKKYLAGKKPKRLIYVPQKILNLVID